jgi:hypothetical protein
VGQANVEAVTQLDRPIVDRGCYLSNLQTGRPSGIGKRVSKSLPTRSPYRRTRWRASRTFTRRQATTALALALASRCRTKKLSSSQPKDSPYRRTLSRVCSNAWLGLF